ncbi:Outer membrane lipoprotein pcp [Thiomonas sp. X19]|uniref:glycine zipper 2TM domain-containing protein n=1 Tax=Thiomonas sp. X19 TaxID=1050370 RepID=UPI000B6C49D5|nr:glycine zipper 2TM domain-containing protein [Thiomonas sp. X19]SCC95088.1 Outer membrane lipoprotein pcp [Thiomonas sp. X19]
MQHIKPLTITALAAALALGGCAGVPPGLGGQYQSSAYNYSASQAQQVQQVQLGTVLYVQQVTIRAGQGVTGAGSTLGAVAGGFAGSRVGQGTGSAVGAVIGALGGAAAGDLAAGKAYQQPGLQITVRLDNGQTIAVTQAADVPIHAGQRVELLGSQYGWGQPARVVPIG